MLPDSGKRYLSTPLFEGIAADMRVTNSKLRAQRRDIRWRNLDGS